MRHYETAKIKSGSFNALYLNNAEYTRQQNNIETHESAQKLDTSALSYDKEINGTDCVGLLLEHWRDVAGAGDEFRSFGTGVVAPALNKQQVSVNTIDQINAESIRLKIKDVLDLGNSKIGTGGVTKVPSFNIEVSDVVDTGNYNREIEPAIWEYREPRGTNPFDIYGSFGGNQSDLGAGWQFLWWIKGENDDVYNLVRSYDDYKNASEKEIHDLLNEISEHGCSYVAAVNSLFDQYKDDPEGFERIFGFPMVGKDGELNFRLLIVDFYLNTGKRIFLDENDSIQQLASYFHWFPEDIKDYEQYLDENAKKLDLERNLWSIATHLYDEFLKRGIHQIITKNDGTGATMYNRLLYYCKKKGADIEIEKIQDKSTEFVQQALNNGYSVVMEARNIELERVDGLKYFYGADCEAHSMSITGTRQGVGYYVSSWGERYFINLNNNSDEMKLFDFYAIKRKSKEKQYKYVPKEEWN